MFKLKLLFEMIWFIKSQSETKFEFQSQVKKQSEVLK